MEEVLATAYKSELNFISRCVLDYPDLETGGDYFGFWNKYGLPVIMYVTGPGPKTSRTSTSFFQDIDYLHKTGNYLNSRHGLEHIGSWHSHHKLALECPSFGDVNTMKNAFLTLKLHRFFITICNIKNDDKIKVNGYLFSNDYRNFYQQVKWNIIENPSPLRQQEKDNELFITPQNQKGIFIVDRPNAVANSSYQEKIVFSNDSFFQTQEGTEFLRREYLKLQNYPECHDVEIVQNSDETIGITFKYEGKNFEIRYPNDFSKGNPNPSIIEMENDQVSRTYVIESESEKMYFIRPFDLFKEFKRLVFGFHLDQK